MKLVNILFNKQAQSDKLYLGGATGLWFLARNKVINLPNLIIYLKQAQDPELKNFLQLYLDDNLKVITQIKNFLKDRGFHAPDEPYWKDMLNDNSAFIIPSTILNDEKIANSLIELLRLSLTLIAESLRNAVTEEPRETIYNLLTEENNTYDQLIQLRQKKNWFAPPPFLSPL